MIDSCKLYVRTIYLYIYLYIYYERVKKRYLPVRNGISSFLVLSAPKASAIVDSFFIEFSLNYKIELQSSIHELLQRESSDGLRYG